VTAGQPPWLTVDPDRCVSAGQCVRIAPGLFDQSDEDGRVALLTGSPPDDHRPQATTAAALCPARAILIDGAAPH
jgi:ferredoxin